MALLERGGPMSLDEVAGRFADAGIASAADALAALKRCRPARPPVYRDGDRYALDPYDDELDLWAFRLGLRPPRVARPVSSPNAPKQRASTDELAQAMRNYERRRAAHAAELAALRRVIVLAFPQRSPRVVTFVDVDQREIATMVDAERAELEAALRPFDVLSGVDIRATLRALGIDVPLDRRLAELGAPQKTMRLSRSRVIDLAPDMLIRGTCRISRPLHDNERLRNYLAANELAKVQRCLESDARSLHAYHEYGRLHGFVRVRAGAVDATVQAPWHHPDEPTLYTLMKQAWELAMSLEVVLGAPEWNDPWARAVTLDVERGVREHELYLVDERGDVVDDRDVQLARLEASIH
ncbi:MAG: hypothetical protein KF773_38385 [Deltaproteobacteria bacterium]|nr:hypothetical protein [Deltaproteobacteria bacterium]